MQYFTDSASAAPTTFNIRRRVLRGFFEWAKSEGIVGTEIMRGIAMRRKNDVPRSVDEHLIKKLLALTDITTFAGLRDLALLVLTVDTGIRPKEAFGLLLDDLNLRSLEMVIRAPVAKTRVPRTQTIPPIAAEKLRKHASVKTR